MYHSHSNSSSFSMANLDDDHDDLYSYSANSVDCTLSLGTPSTRLSDGNNNNSNNTNNHQKKRMSGWKLFPTSSKNSAPPPSSASKSHRSSNSASASSDDTLWARRCANCDATSTPLWRNGPRGPKSLCNACGIRYKKEERRAMEAAASAAANSPALAAPQYMMNGVSQWPDTTMPCYSSAYGNGYQDDVMYHHDSNTNGFHSWPYGEAEYSPSFYS